MTLKQILSEVRRQLPPSFDVESIACDLWMEAWMRLSQSNPVEKVYDSLDPPISREVIRNRCVDEIRKSKQEQKLMNRPSFLSEGDIEVADMVESLLNAAHLTRQQQKVIIERFYLGCSLKLIAKHLLLSEAEVSTLLHSTIERLRAVAREMKGSEE